MPARAWADLTSDGFAALDPRRTVALLPVTAIEQHGPHLPLGTDALINRAVMTGALACLRDDLLVLTLPEQTVGTSDEHASFPGTLSLPVPILLAAWEAIGDGVARAGLRKLLIFNSHGGQSHLCEPVALALRRRHGMLVAWASWTALGLPDGLFPAAELAFGIHAGAVETSCLLALRPDLVRSDRLSDQPSLAADMAARFRHLSAGRRVGFGWLMEDLNASGAVGDPRLASAAAGKALLDNASARLAELIAEVAEFELPAPR